MTTADNYLAALHALITANFNEQELAGFYHELGINPDGLRPEELSRELLRALSRQGRLPELLALLQAARPEVAWPPVLPDFASAVTATNVVAAGRDREIGKQGASFQARLDVATPEQVTIGVPFDMAVAVRRPDSPLLQEHDLNNVRSGDLQLAWPDNANAITLRAQVHAPDCRIDGEAFQMFQLFRDRDSTVVYFTLTPLRAGSLAIRVTIYQAFLALGSARLTAHAGEKVAGVVATHVVSQSFSPQREADEAYGLYNVLDRAFSLNELKELAFKMGVDLDDLPGDNRRIKCIELVKYCRNRGRLGELIERTIAARPNWFDTIEAGV